MKLLVYSTKPFEKPFLELAHQNKLQVQFIPDMLKPESAELAKGFEMISIFAGDDASGPVLEKLFSLGVRYIAIRAAGYDNVDLKTASHLGIRVANVPAYSPYAIAEHAVAMVMALNRKLIKSNEQVHRKNFIVDNLIGFDMHGKTVGIIGTGKIGSVAVKIFHGFGCELLAYDIDPDQALEKNYGVQYVRLEELCSQSDIISIHTCLVPETKYLINRDNLRLMKNGVILINTSRGAVINTEEVLEVLESGKIGGLGLDVYEKERGYFFYDYSQKELNDPLLEKLLSHPNVLITPHQAFATREALTNIADTTFENIHCWMEGASSPNEVNQLQEPIL